MSDRKSSRTPAPVIVEIRLLAAAPIDVVAMETVEAAARMQEEEAADDLEAVAPAPPVRAAVVSEADAVAFFSAAPERLAPYMEQEGFVGLTCGDVSAGFGDTLMWLGPKLCFEAVGHVLEHGTGSFRLFSAATEVTLRREGDEIEISADIMEPARFPAMPLLVALVEAGSRLVALVEEVWAGDAEAVEALPWLHRTEAAARARIEAAGASGVTGDADASTVAGEA